jgi:hypothetical protein
MDARLQEMLDHYEIQKAIAVYVHGCDRVDAERIASVYHSDSWDDHGLLKCNGADFAKNMSRMVGATDMAFHVLGQSLITVKGDEAGAETTFITAVRIIGDNGVPVLSQMGGRYCDIFKRENGAWKLHRRTCVRDWSISHDIVKDDLLPNNFVEGERSEKDPSFKVLGWKHSGPPRAA